VSTAARTPGDGPGPSIAASEHLAAPHPLTLSADARFQHTLSLQLILLTENGVEPQGFDTSQQPVHCGLVRNLMHQPGCAFGGS